MKYKKFLLTAVMALTTVLSAYAQRSMDKLDRGLVAVKTTNGVYCSWRIFGEEYYDVTYNIYRDGTKLNASPLTVSNFTDAGGSTSSTYQVEAVVRGTAQAKCDAVKPWGQNFLEITPDHGNLTSTYVPNDACCADVDGDGEVEILLKFDNDSDSGSSYMPGGYNGEYAIVEVYKLDGTKLWWLDFGPNMGDFQNNENNIVAYDWDQDGRAEALMRAADGTVIHAADGQTYVVGDATKNYRSPNGGGGTNWFMHEGAEYLVYMDGQTGKPYQIMDYPLKRLESGETNLEKAWGDGYGHRSTKHFFGAPYLDGRKPSIFLARGIYTRHKMVALDVNPSTHKLTERWRWNCNDSSSPWYGNGYHNYSVADVDWDGRDEIVFGSMVIDDNGKGLSTTGLGHGDAQHCSDFDPYTHGHEIFAAMEDHPGNNFRDATTSKIYYRYVAGDDDGRAIMGNFSNDYPGAQGISSRDPGLISSVTHNPLAGTSKDAMSIKDNFRIYWDGDLLEETFNGTGYTDGNKVYHPGAGAVFKGKGGILETLTGSFTNNYTKATPCYQGDILGDWREEVIMRTGDNKIRIYTTTYPTQWRNYTLWHDMQYRQAMVWQMCGYNQPPHTSYFLGELEGITQAPPALTMTDRTEIANGGSIGSSHNDKQIILCETGNMTVSVSDGAAPYIFFDNAPTWVQGHDDNNNITTTTYTHTLTGGAFTGEMRLVKQGDGVLTLPNVTETYTGNTDIWAGTLNFDGTMQNSRVWLNRFAELNSNGKFMKGIEMDYAAILRPGGANKQGTVETSELKLNFGSRVVMDVYSEGLQADLLKATKLIVEKKDWKNGPQYSTPVLEFVPHANSTLAAGKYLIGEIGSVEGNLDDIVMEGLSGVEASLSYEEGKLYLTVGNLRDATTLTWSGNQGNVWNLNNTENFMNTASEASSFVSGDAIIFDDNAQSTNVEIAEDVHPSSVVFNNNTKNYTLSGKAIAGTGTLTVNGTGNVTLNNANTYTGGTMLNAGKMTVSSLANSDGMDYGALGGTSSQITLSGGTLAVSQTLTSTQPVLVKPQGGTIEVPSGLTYTQNGAVTQSGSATLHKKGTGTLQLGTGNKLYMLYVDEGMVTFNERNDVMSTPDNIVLNGNDVTVKDADNMYSYSTNKANFQMTEGTTANFFMDSRCNYTGNLTGKGTLNLNVPSVRNQLSGNWSLFNGTINVIKRKSGSYDPQLYINNNNGFRNATLNVDAPLHNGGNQDDFITQGHSVALGGLTGTGELRGAGRYTIGYLNNDITWTGTLAGCQVTKVGSGLWTISKLPSSMAPGNVEVRGGVMNLNNSAASTLFFGSNPVVVGDSGTLAGRAYVQKIDIQKGGTLSPGQYGNLPVGIIKVKEAVFSYAGSNMNFYILNAKNQATSRSYLEIGGTFSLSGTVNVTLNSSYKPKVGDEIVLWKAGSFMGTPSAVNLPELPSGFAWDDSQLLTVNGILRVVEGATGIVSIGSGEQVRCKVYSLGGQLVGEFDAQRGEVESILRGYPLRKGNYVLKMQAAGKVETKKIILK